MQALACSLFTLTLSLAAASQDGFIGFFASNCPSGWSELTSLEGRLLLLVNNSFQAGESVGFPLADREERTHTHAVSGSFNLPSKEVSALGGSNTDGAHSGKQPLLGFLNSTTASSSGFPLVQLTACRYNAISFQPAPTLPASAIALWDPATATTGCPAGSAPLTGANGRLLVLSNATGLATNPGAAPLTPGQDMQHTHAFSAPISLDGINYLGIHGCCDNDVAASGSASASGTTSPASLGLPYQSILACNTTAAAPLAAPLGMLLLTVDPAGCPSGWAPSGYAGNALVATPPYGVPGSVWGGSTPLSPATDPYPAHAPHTFSLQVDLYPAGVELATQGGGSYGRAESLVAQGATAAAVVAAEEQLPLAFVLACERV